MKDSVYCRFCDTRCFCVLTDMRKLGDREIAELKKLIEEYEEQDLLQGRLM